MNRFLLTIFLLVPVLTNAQDIKKSDLIGEWEIIKGETTSKKLPSNVNQMMGMMIDGFKQSTWIFSSDDVLKIEFKQNLSPIMEDMKFLNNKLWIYDSSKNQVRIGTNEDSYSHLVLIVKRVESQIQAYFSNTPIYLTIKKKI